MSDRSDASRRAVNKIFGDALPSTTADERDDQASHDDAERDRWLRDNVPPHHG